MARRGIRRSKPIKFALSESEVERLLAGYVVGEIPVVPGETFATPCWLWVRKTDKYGYGRYCLRRQWIGAHRVSFHHFKGPLTAGLETDHRCHTRNCIQPDHLVEKRPIENRNCQMHGGQLYGRYAPQAAEPPAPF